MNSRNDIFMQNKVFLWIASATAFILTVPLVAMQFTSEVNWTVSDFAVMGLLIFGMGSLFILLARKITKRPHRLMVAVGVALIFFWLWAELAVGIFTNWGS